MKSFKDVMTFRDKVEIKWNPVENQSQEQENYYGDESGEERSEGEYVL